MRVEEQLGTALACTLLVELFYHPPRGTHALRVSCVPTSPAARERCPRQHTYHYPKAIVLQERQQLFKAEDKAKKNGDEWLKSLRLEMHRVRCDACRGISRTRSLRPPHPRPLGWTWPATTPASTTVPTSCLCATLAFPTEPDNYRAKLQECGPHSSPTLIPVRLSGLIKKKKRAQ